MVDFWLKRRYTVVMNSKELAVKTDWTLYIYRRDRRCKTGERVFSTTVWTGRNSATMGREITELYPLYPATQGWRMEFHPKML